MIAHCCEILPFKTSNFWVKWDFTNELIHSFVLLQVPKVLIVFRNCSTDFPNSGPWVPNFDGLDREIRPSPFTSLIGMLILLLYPFFYKACTSTGRSPPRSFLPRFLFVVPARLGVGPQRSWKHTGFPRIPWSAGRMFLQHCRIQSQCGSRFQHCETVWSFHSYIRRHNDLVFHT